MIAGVMELFARIIVALVLVPMFGYLGAVLASPVAWTSAVAFLFPTYIIMIKKACKRNVSLVS